MGWIEKLKEFARNVPKSRDITTEYPPTRVEVDSKARDEPLDATQLATEIPVQMSGPYSVGSSQIVGMRDNQEDSYGGNWRSPQLVERQGLLAIVADGIGGLEAGELSSNTAVHAMCQISEALNPATPADIALLKMLGGAQQEVLRLSSARKRTGTTLIAVLIRDGWLSFLSVGDSRIALYRGNALLQLNREHVFRREADEESVLRASDNDGHKNGALTSFVGKENLRLVDRNLQPIRLLSQDRILLMSDGVFGTLSDDELMSAMELPPQKATERIMAMIADKKLPHQDNATVVIVEMNE